MRPPAAGRRQYPGAGKSPSGRFDQIRSHQLGRDALGLGGVVVQLDLDAIRVEEEELEQRLAVRATLREIYLFISEMLQHRAQTRGAESDVVDRAGARAAALRGAAEVFFLVLA